MTSVLLLAAALTGVDDRPRIREELPNGTQVLAIRTADSGRAVVSVFASVRGMGDEPGNHGVRHLLEHLLAKGPGKDADARLEAEGVLLTARTTRAGLWLSTSGPAEALPLAVTVLAESLSRLETTQEEINRELAILKQEQRLLGPWWGFDALAWTTAFGTGAVDPFGDLELLSKATPEALATGRGRVFSGPAVGVVVAGDVLPSAVILRLKEAFSGLSRGAALRPERRPEALTGTVDLRGGKGASRSLVVPGMGRGATAAAVGMAMVLAGKTGGSVVYDPALQPGLVTVWSPTIEGWAAVDGLSPEQVVELYPQARSAAGVWWRSLSGSLEGRADLEAMILAERSVSSLEVMGSYPAGATDAELRAAWEGFRKGKGVEVTGW